MMSKVGRFRPLSTAPSVNPRKTYKSNHVDQDQFETCLVLRDQRCLSPYQIDSMSWHFQWQWIQHQALEAQNYHLQSLVLSRRPIQ